MKTSDRLPKREQLEHAIAAQESLRGTLDDTIIDVTIAALRSQLTELDRTLVLEQQRKLATILFMDVVSSTRLMREIDPEDHLSIMDAALQKLAVQVEIYGGKVFTFLGDGFMAVFGLPNARENDPEMAVRAGLGILETAQKIARELEEEGKLKEFQVRVGVNTGLVVTSGTPETEITVMGTAVNLAARLEGSAPPGGLLISQDTYQHVRGIFDVEPSKATQMKGFAKTIKVYLVKKAKPHAFRLVTRGVEGIDTHMVGREDEIHTLQVVFDTVFQESKARFVTIVAEAGLGKSRLLHEFEGWLNHQPIPFELFKGRATLESLDLPYGLLRDLMTPRLGILDDDPISVVRNKVIDGFRETLGEVKNLKMYAHFAGQLLGYDFRDSPYLQGVLDAPQQIHDRAVVYLSEYFKALAVEQPLVIFLDDIHWADGSSLDILLHMAQELSDYPILFVALSRPSLFERRQSWGKEPFHQRLDLHPLSDDDSRHLIEDVLRKVQDLPESLSNLIIRSAEGNPYYLEELVKMLVEDGVIVKDEPKWRVHTDRLVNFRVPPTLTGVIQARLDSLSRMERIILQQASVIGRVFWDKTVLHVNKNMPSDQMDAETGAMEIIQNLDSLQNREMVFQRNTSAFSDTAEYVFKHTILWEVAYEGVLKRTRRVYHGIVADWLIANSGERSGEFTGLIARHLEKAGRNDEALEYLCRAAEAATENFAVNEAEDFYARALALTPEDDLKRRYTLLFGSEKIFNLQGNRDAQRETLEALTTIADSLEGARKKVEVSIRSAWFAYSTSDFPAALEKAERAVALADAAQERVLAGQAKYAMAWAHLQQGDFENGLTRAKEALPLARQAGDRRGEGNTLNILGMISITQGDYLAARSYLEGFLAIARELGDREREITALNNLGVALTILGKYQAAIDYFQQDWTIAREMGDRLSESTALVNLAWVNSARGDWATAVKNAQSAILMKREFEQTEAVAEGLVWLGHAWVGLGELDEAIRAFREALEIRQKLNQSHLAVEVIAGLARAKMTQGDMQAAQSDVEKIMAYLSGGSTLDGTWEPLRIYLTCYRVLQVVEDPRAEKLLDEAYSRLQEQAARIPYGEDRQQFLEGVPWHREIVTYWEASQSLK